LQKLTPPQLSARRDNASPPRPGASKAGPELRKREGEEGFELFHAQKSMSEPAYFRGHFDIGVGNLVADVVGAIGKRYLIVGIMKFRVMVEDLRLDRHLHDEGYGVAKGLEFE
jgi:hypothetical protein